jgi:hypothetical protein
MHGQARLKTINDLDKSPFEESKCQSVNRAPRFQLVNHY